MLVFTALFGCQQLPATGDPLAPAPVTKKVAPASASTGSDDGDAEATAGDQGGFDFDADAEEIEGSDLPDDPAAILAMQQGLDAVPPAPEPVAAEPVPMAEPVPGLALPAELPSMPTLDRDWGLRLMATVHNVEPPRAILGLPDGTEAVVTAGTMLPEQNAIVMAVGRQQIEIAWVTPNGYQARIETERISALYPE